MTQLTILYIEKNYPGQFNLQTRALKDTDHTYLVLGAGEEKVVCDPWDNFACDWSQRDLSFQALQDSLAGAAQGYMIRCKAMFDGIIQHIQESKITNPSLCTMMCKTLELLALEISSVNQEYSASIHLTLNKTIRGKKLSEIEQLMQFDQWSKQNAAGQRAGVNNFDHLAALYVQAKQFGTPENAGSFILADEGYDMSLNADFILNHSRLAQRFAKDYVPQEASFEALGDIKRISVSDFVESGPILNNVADLFKTKLLQLGSQYLREVGGEAAASDIRKKQISEFE